jgi:hypothetical protein
MMNLIYGTFESWERGRKDCFQLVDMVDNKD